MNKHDILWFVILAVFTIVLGILLIGGGIAMYLAPHMFAVAWFGFAALGALTVYQGYRTIRSEKQSKGSRLYGIVFLIPIALLLTVMPDNTTPSTLSNSSMALSGNPKTESADDAFADSPVSDTPKPAETPADPETTAVAESTEPPAKTNESAESQQITASDAKLLMPCALTEATLTFDAANDAFHDYIYMSLEELMNEQVTLTGYIYKDPSFPEDTVLVSRLMISCCVADASVIGFHVRVEDEDAFEEGEWITVTGTVQTISLEMNGTYYDFPIITAGTVTRCETPEVEDAYVYP
jgi:putative membrane protein